jgi:Carboxypeptidase regulatory-like domain
MTTLGALLVGLVLLLVLLGVLVWMQRRPRRGPEQPRTVADLVRMREAAAQSSTDVVPVEELPAPDASEVVEDDAPSEDDEPVASPEPVAPQAERPMPDPDEQKADEPSPLSPEDAAVDTPWARAARMAASWPERDAEEPRAATRPSLALLPTSYPKLAEPVRPRSLPVVAAESAVLAPVERAPKESAASAPQGGSNGVSGVAPLLTAAPEQLPAPQAEQPAGSIGGSPQAEPAAGTEQPAVSTEVSARVEPEATPALSSLPNVEPTREIAAPIKPTTNGHGPTPTPARVAGRVRRSRSATPAEQAAADLALLRTFGVARPTPDEPEVALEGCAADDDVPVVGTAQPVTLRVPARDGRGIPGATVTLLDDHGRETASTRTNRDGHAVLNARHAGGYMVVAAADGYQPGAITIAVTDEPVDAEIPLTRSASLAGTVGGEDGPIVGAQLALVQDGEIVDTTQSTADGGYRFRDLAAGEYGLSVTAHECEPAALVLTLADEADLHQDVELVPAGLPADDVMIGRR